MTKDGSPRLDRGEAIKNLATTLGISSDMTEIEA